MPENFEICKTNRGGMKIQVDEIRDISPEGIKNLKKNLRGKVKKVFKPLQVIYMPYAEVSNQKKLAHFVYSNFGTNDDGKIYRLLYWRKVNHWSRRYARLCWIHIKDLDAGKYEFEIIKGLGNLRRFKWFTG